MNWLFARTNYDLCRQISYLFGRIVRIRYLFGRISYLFIKQYFWQVIHKTIWSGNDEDNEDNEGWGIKPSLSWNDIFPSNDYILLFYIYKSPIFQGYWNKQLYVHTNKDIDEKKLFLENKYCDHLSYKIWVSLETGRFSLFLAFVLCCRFLWKSRELILNSWI